MSSRFKTVTAWILCVSLGVAALGSVGCGGARQGNQSTNSPSRNDSRANRTGF